MKTIIIAFVVFLSFQPLMGQSSESTVSTDSLYREDQVYLGFTYNILEKKPSNVAQNGFSSGIHLGIIRDFPINKKRDFAIGIGLGFSLNSFNQNIKISESNNGYEFEILSNGSFKQNRLDMYLLELPVEFRWRTSTPTKYDFWRIYGGIKFGYAFSSKTKFKSEEEAYKIGIDNLINKFQYGLTLSVGYDSWNIHLYYGLNTLFDNQVVNDETINIIAIKAGLIFYML